MLAVLLKTLGECIDDVGHVYSLSVNYSTPCMFGGGGVRGTRDECFTTITAIVRIMYTTHTVFILRNLSEEGKEIKEEGRESKVSILKNSSLHSTHSLNLSIDDRVYGVRRQGFFRMAALEVRGRVWRYVRCIH